MEFNKLPQLEGWANPGDEFDPRAFLLANITVSELASLSLILWPEFIEYRSCVFRRTAFDQDSVNAWFEELGGDRLEVELVVNHLHLWDAFLIRHEVEYKALEELAEPISEMWKAALSDNFQRESSSFLSPTITVQPSLFTQ